MSNRGIYSGVPFGAIQTNFYDQQATSTDGRLAYASDIDLCDAIAVAEEGGIGVGYGVKIVAIDGKRPGINDQSVVLPDENSVASDFGGLVIRTMAGNTGADGENYMREGSMATVLRKERVGGRVYVKMDDAFTAGNNAYWRIADRVNSDVKVGRLCGSEISGSASTAGSYAEGFVSMSTNPADGDTLTIGSVTYTFKDELESTANQIKIGDDLQATGLSLIAVINGTASSGTDCSEGTTSPLGVATASAQDNGTLKLTATTVGSAGNDITLSASGSATVTAFSGGEDPTVSEFTDTVELEKVKFRSSGVAGDLALVEFITA